MAKQSVPDPMAITPVEAFRKLGISQYLGWKMIREGKLPAVRLGERRWLIPVAALEKLLSTGKEG